MENFILPSFAAWTLIAFGVLLMGLEMFMTVFVMLFFGLAFIIVGGITFIWPTSGENQILMALVLGAVLLFVLRKAFLKNMNQAEPVKLETFEGGEIGKIVNFNNFLRVEYKGTTWAIKNKQDEILEPGQEVKVVRIQNNEATIETL